MFWHGIRRDVKSVLQPWHLLLFIIAGWVNRHQQDVVEYLRTENQVLKEKLGKKRILLRDDQRRRLAVKGKILGRKALEEIASMLNLAMKHGHHFFFDIVCAQNLLRDGCAEGTNFIR